MPRSQSRPRNQSRHRSRGRQDRKTSGFVNDMSGYQTETGDDDYESISEITESAKNVDSMRGKNTRTLPLYVLT